MRAKSSKLVAADYLTEANGGRYSGGTCSQGDVEIGFSVFFWKDFGLGVSEKGATGNW